MEVTCKMTKKDNCLFIFLCYIGWSAPSGVSMSSLGFGHQAGGQVIDSIIVMNYRAAVKAFYDGGGQLQLGVGASLAAGPFGRAADVAASASSTTHIAATYAYSASKGLYAGYSFEGSKISERPNTNRAYYGRAITAKEILTGCVPPTQDAANLYTMLINLGAGPRPGLPFAPQKAQNMPPHMGSAGPPPQPPRPEKNPGGVPQPPRPQKNNGDDLQEPPPPYEQFDPSKPIEQQPKDTDQQTTNPSPVADQALVDVDELNQVNNESTSQHVSNQANDLTSTSNALQSSVPPSINTSSKPVVSTEPENPHAYTPSSSGGHNFDSAYNISTLLDDHGYPQDIKKPLKSITSVVVAKYDYIADRPADLSFKAGDKITVTKRLEDRQAWWEGEIGGKRGFFPANYTEEQ
jgi:hypothetical protein